jgi:hypothetical protein
MPHEDEIVLNDDERAPCEVWSRVMGYHWPVSDWNTGKKCDFSCCNTGEKGEFGERQYFNRGMLERVATEDGG